MELFQNIALIFLSLYSIDLPLVSAKLGLKQNSDTKRDFIHYNYFTKGNTNETIGYVDLLSILTSLRDIATVYLPDDGTSDNLSSRKYNSLALFGNYTLHKNEDVGKSLCFNDTLRLAAGLVDENKWAIQFLDASGKPGPSLTRGELNFVGNYDQCKSATTPSSSDENGRAREFSGGYFRISLESGSIPILIQIGTCLPDTCSEKEIAIIGGEFFKTENISLSIASVVHVTNDTEVTSATIIAILMSCIIGLMIILGTAFDLIFVQFPLKYGGNPYQHADICNGAYANMLDDNNEMNCKEINMSYPSGYKNVAGNILLAFSVYSNAKKALNVSQAPGSIESIHGIRFLSISWVILGHTYILAMSHSINVATAVPELFSRWTFDAIANALLSVDTFFTLSGLLTSYVTIGQLLSKGLKLNWPMFYFHRFWRLTPPYMLSILLVLGFQQYFVTGALRNNDQPNDKSSCEQNWWTNLLYVNNFVEMDHMCFGHSWYLANDMQFFILSPLMIIPFYFHRIAGLCSCLIFLLASWITTGVSSTLEEWVVATGAENMNGNEDYQHHYYNKPWCRIGPYIVGILAGYILAIQKGRPFYIKWWIVVIGWITSAVSALAVLYGLRGDISGNDPSSVGVRALYNTVARSVWGACVSWVIIACTAGYGGPVNSLLSWSPFVVLGRISYMVYLLHIAVLHTFYQNLDRLFYMNDTTMVVFFLGLLVASNLVAFIFMLGLESPMIGLEKTILKPESKRRLLI